MRRVRSPRANSQQLGASRSAQVELPVDDGTATTQCGIAMIQALIPLGLRAVEEALQSEVRDLAGHRYAYHDSCPDVNRPGIVGELVP
jgi:hypothetical protein